MNKIYFSFLVLSLLGCRKENNDCTSIVPDLDFSILEHVGDSSFVTDTAFTFNRITFQTGPEYDSISWSIGEDNRRFYTRSFDMIFDYPITVGVTLRAIQNNFKCSLVRQGLLTTSKQLTVVKSDGTFISPLTGDFLGYIEGLPLDTFTVSIKYWIGNRYPFWPTGAYSIHNIPKGYINEGQSFNGLNRPEINGIVASNGYKSLAFDKSGNFPAAELKDTLV